MHFAHDSRHCLPRVNPRYPLDGGTRLKITRTFSPDRWRHFQAFLPQIVFDGWKYL